MGIALEWPRVRRHGHPDTPGVVITSDAFVRTFLAGQSQSESSSSSGRPPQRRIIGVARDVKHFGPTSRRCRNCTSRTLIGVAEHDPRSRHQRRPSDNCCRTFAANSALSTEPTAPMSGRSGLCPRPPEVRGSACGWSGDSPLSSAVAALGVYADGLPSPSARRRLGSAWPGRRHPPSCD
jgi:hypothetical protein